MILRRNTKRGRRRESGAVAILAMMFLVIFGSLGVAMAIVAQGNLATADAQLKISQSLALAETGMNYITYQIDTAASSVMTTDGLISSDNAPALWLALRDDLKEAMLGDTHASSIPSVVGTTLYVGPIAMSDGGSTFEAELTPHPIDTEDYDSAFYQRAPYNEMTPVVSSVNPLDSTWIRVKVTASSGPAGSEIFRSISLDFKLDKKIRFAMLSKSRVMIGRNVVIDGPVGSRFVETWIDNGHPIQMVSDFYGLDTDPVNGLDIELDDFYATWLLPNESDGDNRINLSDPSETPIDDFDTLTDMDINEDGYVDEYDIFLDHFDSSADGAVTLSELTAKADTEVEAQQLLEMIDTFGDPTRDGYGDDIIDHRDRYAKIDGNAKIKADLVGWEEGAAAMDDGTRGSYLNYYQGPVRPDYQDSPIEFAASDSDVLDIGPTDFDVSSFEAVADASDSLATQATAQEALHDAGDPLSPQPLGTIETEEVPFGSAHPYDYYDRPVYENMTFTDVKIPKGTNAVFKNCHFVGVTFIDTETNNSDPNFNYAGMSESDGSQKFPDMAVDVAGAEVTDTKTISNNLRFHGCTFEGAVVSQAAPSYTHVRNKIAFTGTTRFDIDGSTTLTDAEKQLYRRSTILTPHYSVEMGSFTAPADTGETLELSGTIVAGVIDMRGQVKVNGSILTTFEPQSDVAPVIGQTSPQFNTTLGYFSSADGDVEAELPASGVGVIQVTYDPSMAMPDGINAPIELKAITETYYEGGG